MFDAVCVRGGADLSTFRGSVWFVQTQSHDLHHRTPHHEKKVSLDQGGATARKGRVPEAPSLSNSPSLAPSVSVRLSVRSRARDGLILLLSDSKQMDFVVLKLAGGRLMMSADLGKGSASVTSSVAVDDGEWHTVSYYLQSLCR